MHGASRFVSHTYSNFILTWDKILVAGSKITSTRLFVLTASLAVSARWRFFVPNAWPPTKIAQVVLAGSPVPASDDS